MKLHDGMIMAEFEHIGRGKVTYVFALSTYFNWSKVRNIPLKNLIPPDFCTTHRAEIICWVSENKRPFKIVTNHGFRSLMRTGRPEYHIPSAETISCDVQNTFINVWICIAKMLQVSTMAYIFLIINSPSASPGTRRGTELCNRCMDIPKPQGICGGYGPFQKQGGANGDASWHCGTCTLAFWLQFSSCICEDPWRFRNQWQGKQVILCHRELNWLTWYM